MRYIWMILAIMCFTGVLLACQSAAPSTSAPQEPITQTDTTQALPPSPQENTAMPPVTPPNEAAERLVTLVKGHLSQRLGIAVDQIVLSDIKPVVWRDAGLGCPKPGVDYIQVETPGYNILLEANGNSYRYHTDETRRFVPCNR